MSFRLVPISVTLDDLERRISSNRCVISPNLVAFGTNYVKVVEDVDKAVPVFNALIQDEPINKFRIAKFGSY